VVTVSSRTVLSPLEMDMQPAKSTAPHDKSIVIRIKIASRAFYGFLPTQQSVSLLVILSLRDDSFVVGGLEIRELSFR
jgi:hypothetical protein